MLRRAVVVLGLVLGIVLVGGCGGDDRQASPSAPPAPAPSVTGTTQGGPSAEDASAGEAIFATVGCAACHTLAAAGATGRAGPNLDDLRPGFDAVVNQVTNGGGGMPPFGDRLSEQEIRDVAAYVVQSTSGGSEAPGGATTDDDGDEDGGGPGGGDDDEDGGSRY